MADWSRISREEAILLAQAELGSFVPVQPHPQQQYFLTTFHNYRYREALFGGGAGGGKTVCLLMAALQYAHHTGYHALLLRKTFRDLSQPGALIPLSLDWLSGKAEWNAQAKRWTFPSGSTLTFGYLDSPGDVYQYQGANFGFIGFDEATQFRENDYRYLFSRLRKRVEDSFPLRVRSTSNPGGIGHEWVKKRFLIDTHPERLFVPSLLQDNPSLDREDYVQSLAHLDPITRAQLLEGDWDAYQGGRFLPSWFAGKTYTAHEGKYYPRLRAPDGWHRNSCQVYVIVDLAASEKTSADYTVFGAFLLTPEQDLLVLDIRRERLPIDRIVPELLAFCTLHRPLWVGIEANGFQVAIVSQAQRTAGMPPVRGLATGGKSKLVRATPAIIRAQAGQIFVPVSSPWLEDFLAELTQFTGDDRLDSSDDQCLAAGTLIETLRGSVPIEEVKAGEMVLTRAGYRRVMAAGMTNPAATVMEVVLADRRIMSTPGHPFWVDGRGFVPIGVLAQEVAWAGRENISAKRLSSRVSPSGAIPIRPGAIYESTTDVAPCISGGVFATCTRKSGRQRMGRSLMAATSITRTATPSTTIWPTWNACQRQSIDANTRAGEITLRRRLGGICRRFARWLLPGINRRKAGNGIGSMESSVGINYGRKSLTNTPAQSAARSTAASLPETTRSSVLVLVAPKQEGCQESITSRDPASCAGNRSLPVDTQSSAFALAPVLAVRALPNAMPVYNLTVEGEHEYFANGILVHNCDVLAYAVLAMQGGIKTEPVQSSLPPPDPKRIFNRHPVGKSPVDRLFGRKRR